MAQTNTSTKKFENEEIISYRYRYEEYSGPNPVADQVDRLITLFPELKGATCDRALTQGELPSGSEGWFAIPRKEAIYDRLEKVFERICQDRKGKFIDERDIFGEQYLWDASLEFRNSLSRNQRGHDILLIPAQFGHRHRGRSARRAHEVFAANEFGLGVFEVGIMLLTHPHRLSHYEDLWVGCSGNRHQVVSHPDDSHDESLTLLFSYYGDSNETVFSPLEIIDASPRVGFATGFLPQ